jgi:hypothetical protein
MAIWLSSFPRSGNTLIRQMLYSGWGLVTSSIYPNDLGTNLTLIQACGHVELRRLELPNKQYCILNPNDVVIKTHELPQGNERSFYAVRDGRAACVSTWLFMDKRTPLKDIVLGKTRFGLWSDHVMAWSNMKDLIGTIRYEDIADNTSSVLSKLSAVFGPPNADPTAPLKSRDRLAELDGKWVKPQSDWRDHWTRELETIFWDLNSKGMSLCYPSAERAY